MRADVGQVEGILRRSGFFTADDVRIAVELMEVCLGEPGQTDYDIYSAAEGNAVLGYVCFGPTSLTEGTFDLYWIAVDPARQNQKIGRQLMTFAEEKIRSRRGRLVIVETSSRPLYDSTRKFYLRLEYAEVARIKGYYRPGDDLVIYGKYL